MLTSETELFELIIEINIITRLIVMQPLCVPVTKLPNTYVMFLPLLQDGGLSGSGDQHHPGSGAASSRAGMTHSALTNSYRTQCLLSVSFFGFKHISAIFGLLTQKTKRYVLIQPKS